MKKLWKIRSEIPNESVLGSLFSARQLAREEDIKQFLDPEYSDHHDPYLLKDMRSAVTRIEKAILKQEQITVYADYDADAVTAAAVLLRFFAAMGYAKANYYIPDRFTEGYGMNAEAVQTLFEQGTKLIITVDCGINAFESAHRASELGIDVIITDHHQLTPDPSLVGAVGIPTAVAVVNPHRRDDNYPFKHLTGVGVAFKLVQALVPILHSTSYKLQAGFEKWFLDLVAIGTVADCQSLLGENRILVKWGLYVLAKTRWIGLKKLMKLAGIAKSEMDTYHIGFVIAPRINAAGRMEHADTALRLLLTDDEMEAETLAQKLEALNQARQMQTERILSEAREQVMLYSNHKILLAAGEGWHKGIVGLVAGKLTEEFARPVLVLEKSAEEATGSARSVGSFNIMEAISQSKDILVRYGGHPQAAGFTLRTEHIETFRKNLLDYAEDSLSEDDLSPVLYYDAEINLSQVTDEFVEFIARFEPTGIGNPKPRFKISDLIVKSVKALGNEGKHLRINVNHSSPSREEAGPPEPFGRGMGEVMGCIGFNLGYWADKLKANDRIDIICEPQWNEWNGERKIQLKIVDLQISTSLAGGARGSPGKGWGEIAI